MNLPNFVELILIIFCFLLLAYLFYSRRRFRLVRAKLNDALHKKAEISNFLSLFSRNLRALDEVEESMNMTAQYVADLVEAQSIGIFQAREGYLTVEGVSGAFPPMTASSDYVLTKPRYVLESVKRQKIKIGEGVVGEVARGREPLFLERAEDDPRISEYDSVVPIETLMASPMIHEGNLIGVICAVNNRRERPFTPEQFNRLKFITSQVVLAHNIVQVYSTLSEQQRINQELEFARQIQASLIPESFPSWEQFVVHSFTRSAKEVSGDFYDFVEIDEDRLLLVVGDASGKGVPACMIMGMTRTFIRSNAKRFTTLKKLLGDLNDYLFRDTAEERFITLGCCLLDKRRNTVEYARGGHTSLIMFSRNHIRKIFPNGSALGLLPSELSEFDTFCFQFHHDMSLFLYTDGITEALNDMGEEFGEENLCDSFVEACVNCESPDQVMERVLTSVDRFVGEGVPQADDQTMVIIKHL